MKKITISLVERYCSITKEALEKVKINTYDKNSIKMAEELLKLSRCYFEDSKYFLKKGDLVNAFAAINYAHAFLDCGALLKLFDVSDNRLFMVDKE